MKSSYEKDIEYFYESDPACDSKEEIVSCYPGFTAIFYYRIANILYRLSLNNKEISYQEIEKQFEELVGSNSRYYKAFKDTDVFEDFTVSDKMKLMSEFLGTAQISASG